MPAILRGLDCFVLPSLAEGISNTILEAMASGLPVIATAVGGNPELVEAGRTGELVPAADPEALAERILAYARDPEAARAAGRAGRERVERQLLARRHGGALRRALCAPARRSLAPCRSGFSRDAVVACHLAIAPEGAPHEVPANPAIL